MKKEAEKFILDVVPLTKIPFTSSQSFYYLSDVVLPVGALVTIPLFRQKLDGIVIGIKKDFKRLGDIRLKKIDRVLEENFLDRRQIELAEHISDHYISPLGAVMKNFVPKRVEARKENPEKSIKHKESEKINLTDEQKKSVNEITKSNKLKTKSFLLFGPSGAGKTEVYINSIKKLKEKDERSQFFIMVPEKTLTPQALERYGAHFERQEIVTLSSDLSKGKFFSNWKKVRSGEAKIIIGTRMAVFAPFKKLGLIVIDEEQDMSYKNWDMSPRYDARWVAEKLAGLYDCPIVRGSATPAVETFHKAKEKKSSLLELPKLSLAKAEIKTQSEVVDMKKERWSGNRSSVSKKLAGEIAYALKNRQQVILLVNRQGMSVFSVCDACKKVLKCPQCGRGLVYDREGYYRCLHCSYKSEIFPKCGHCGGLSFKNVGVGTQKVEREVKELFPSAKILLADTSEAKGKDYSSVLYQKFSSHQADILIGTQMISKGWDLPRVALVGIIDADNILSFPDFSTQEKAYQLIVQVSGRVSRPGARFPGMVVIQTFQPELPIIQWAARKDYAAFFDNEVTERRALKLPPFFRLIRLIYQDPSREKTEKESARLYGSLSKLAGLKATRPYSPLVDRIRGKFRRQIVIRTDQEKLPEGARKILSGIPRGWLIDVDPISII